MKRYYSTIPFAAALLLSTLGCSKKDEPAAPATGSYKLDSATIACQATASASTSTSGGLSLSYLTVDLVTTPQPAAGVQTLRLYYVKPNAPSSNTYTLSDITFSPAGNASSYSFAVDAATLTTTSDGGFSGTFAGNVITPSGTVAGPYATITNGVFTNVHP